MNGQPSLEIVSEPSPTKLGINGLGRIGKLSLWHQVERRHRTWADGWSKLSSEIARPSVLALS